MFYSQLRKSRSSQPAGRSQTQGTRRLAKMTDVSEIVDGFLYVSSRFICRQRRRLQQFIGSASDTRVVERCIPAEAEFLNNLIIKKIDSAEEEPNFERG